MEYEVEGAGPRGTPKRTWSDVVQKDCQVRKLKREDAMDCSRWRKLLNLNLIYQTSLLTIANSIIFILIYEYSET